MKNWSAPAVIINRRPARSTGQGQGEPEEEKQVDYSHLDIVAEVERITGCSLKHETKDEYSGRCPFPGCASMTNGFRVWDRPVLERTRGDKREKHFWCRRCDRSGDLISLIQQYREAITGEAVSWKEAARELRIDSRTWRAIDESNEPGQRGQSEGKARATARDQRRQQAEQRRKAGEKELADLDAAYPLARVALASGQIVIGDLTIPLDLAREYLAARGFTLEQAAALGMGYIPMRQEVGRDLGNLLSAWRGRIVFPLTGPKGIRGYAGRSLWKWTPGMSAKQHKKLLEEDEKGRIPRHRKTHQVAYYGYEDACLASTLVIVEGEFDAASVRLALADEPDIAVCAFATNFSARLVPLNVLTVILALDIDQAGEAAIKHQKEELEARGIVVSIVRPPAGNDWNDCHLLAGLGAIRGAIAGQQAEPKEENRGKQRNAPIADAGNQMEYPRKLQKTTEADAGQGTCNSLQNPAIMGQQRIEPPGYENGDICLACGQQIAIEADESLFHIVEDKASEFYGDMFCFACWASRNAPASVENGEKRRKTEKENDLNELGAAALAHIGKVFDSEINGAPVWPEPYTVTLLPAGMSSDEYITRWYQGERPGIVIHPAKMEKVVTCNQGEQAGEDDNFSASNNRCKKHGRALQYSDEQGGRYCDHVDCWERYRLIRAGARRGYPVLAAVVDQRDYLADPSAEPIRYTEPLYQGGPVYPVYPARPVIRQQIIGAGADAWRAYVTGRDYWAIDQAVKALASA